MRSGGCFYRPQNFLVGLPVEKTSEQSSELCPRARKQQPITTKHLGYTPECFLRLFGQVTLSATVRRSCPNKDFLHLFPPSAFLIPASHPLLTPFCVLWCPLTADPALFPPVNGLFVSSLFCCSAPPRLRALYVISRTQHVFGQTGQLRQAGAERLFRASGDKSCRRDQPPLP